MRWLATFLLGLCACGWIALGIRLAGAQGSSEAGVHHSEDFLGGAHDLGALGFLLVGLILVGLVFALGPLAWTTLLALVARRRGVLAKPTAIVLGVSCEVFALRRIQIWDPLANVAPTSPSMVQLLGGLAIAVQVLVGAALIVSAVMARSVSSVATVPPSTSSPRAGAPAGHGASRSTRWQSWSAVALAVVLSVLLRAPSLAAHHAADTAAPVHTEVAQRPLTIELPVDQACQRATDLATFCGPVRAIALSANGHWLVSLSDGGFVVWDLGTRRVAWELPVPTSGMGAQVLVSGDGAHVVLTDGPSVTVFKSNGDPPTVARCQDSTPEALEAASAAFSADESAFAVVSGGVCLFALDGMAPRQQLGAACASTGVTFAERGKALWVACASELRRYALPSGQLTHAVRAESAVSASYSARLPIPTSFDALESSGDGARVLTLGALRDPAPGANSAPTGLTLRPTARGLWQWDAKTGQPLNFARLRWLPRGSGAAPWQSVGRPGQPMNGLAPPIGIGWSDPRTAPTRRAVAPLRVAWFPSLVAISGGGQVFDLQTGDAVYPPDLTGAQLIATARDASVVAVGLRSRPGLGNPTLFVR